MQNSPQSFPSMEPESAASTAAASTDTAIVPAVTEEFEIPAIIAQMVAADASDTYQFKNFIYTVDKHVKFDVTAADTSNFTCLSTV